MTNADTDKEHVKPRVLMFSQRNIFKGALFRCPHYEFEDLVRQIDSVEVLAPLPGKWFNLGNKIANRFANDYHVVLNPGIPKIRLKNTYDLLFAVCGFPKDLLNFDTLKNWKDSCKTSICLLDEIWVSQLPQYECFLKILSKFDYVMLYYSQSVKAVNKVIGNKCSFLPPGVDAFLFCPYPELPERVIDVYSIGRRSEVTHQTLLRMAKENRIFYVHDSISGNNAINVREHRFLVANMAKRSRYFIVNPGKIDSPEERGDQIEIGNRYFEGAAAGTIMIGEQPRNGEFEKLFNWQDAVIQLPYGSDNITSVINELDEQPEKQAVIRKTNVIQSLRRNDWVYRWERILNIAGLPPLPALLERKKHLEDLSRLIEDERNAF